MRSPPRCAGFASWASRSSARGSWTPTPANLGQLLHRADRVIVPEVNLGQFAMIVRAKYLVDARSWSRMRGLPLGVSELTEYLLSQVEEVQHV